MKPIVIACAILLLAVAYNVHSNPTVPCVYVGQYIPDDRNCSEFYQCDPGLNATAFWCDAGNCWDQKDTRCATNLLVCTTPCSTPTAAPAAH